MGIRKIAMVVLLVLVPAGAVMGTVPWMKVFNSQYSPGSETALKKAKCTVCHTTSSGKNGLNAYGKVLDGKSATAVSLKAVESGDADKDGFSNLAEIKAGTLPGDPKSKP